MNHSAAGQNVEEPSVGSDSISGIKICLRSAIEERALLGFISISNQGLGFGIWGQYSPCSMSAFLGESHFDWGKKRNFINMLPYVRQYKPRFIPKEYVFAWWTLWILDSSYRMPTSQWRDLAERFRDATFIAGLQAKLKIKSEYFSKLNKAALI